MSQDQDQIAGLLAKARDSLNAAELLLGKGYVDFAASRAYYCCFYVAEALLLSEGYSYSRHGQVVAQFGRLFSKTEALDRSHHRLLIEALELRQSADYSAIPQTVSEYDARRIIEGGRKFLEEAAVYLDRQ